MFLVYVSQRLSLTPWIGDDGISLYSSSTGCSLAQGSLGRVRLCNVTVIGIEPRHTVFLNDHVATVPLSRVNADRDCCLLRNRGVLYRPCLLG